MGVTDDPGHHLRGIVPDSRQLALCAGIVSGFMTSFSRAMSLVSRPPLIIRLPVEETCASLDHKAVI